MKELCQTASSESITEGEVEGTPTPSDNRRGAADAKEETLPSIKSISADQGTPSKRTWPDRKEKSKVEGIETDPPPLINKERTQGHRLTSQTYTDHTIHSD
jgi:hypothetical protein